jgi:hypothetical protein
MALVVQGPPGFGKTYTMKDILEEYDPSILENNKETETDGYYGGYLVGFMRGHARATGLFKLAYQYRQKGQVILLDDVDGVLKDLAGVNILKIATDTTRSRCISWGTEAILKNEFGQPIPRTFQFQGSIIFCTNLDLPTLAARDNDMAKHYKAILSRAHHVDVGLKTVREKVIRIKQVIADGALNDHDVIAKDMGIKNLVEVVLDYVDEHAGEAKELDLRLPTKLADIILNNTETWRDDADYTLLRK